MTQNPVPTDSSAADQAVAAGGAYDVLRRRLAEQGARLRGIAEQLNAQRLAEFGQSEAKIIGRLRVRTEHNCVPRDLVRVGEYLLFGYNVFLGLKQETRIEDVFALYRLQEGADGYDVVSVDLKDSFLAQPSFANDFRELYAYYKHTRLLQLVARDDKLLASFQIGERIGDIRVFRWSLAADGRDVRYVDNRGERDIALPSPYDFEWTRATREQMVEGRHPHLNILDTVFVETINGDLTIKVENNTEDGLGIYREPVNDQTQSLDDAKIEYARLGSLILLRVLPYREEHWRYLVFNTLTQAVARIDAIGQSCLTLPEDHGIVFPGGCYLANGEYRRFEQPMDGMRFKRAIRSPNGEDVLYVFYEPEAGRFALFSYNLIQRQLQPPLFGHGYARYADGRIVLFSAESEEPTRIHPMQIWQTPFCSDEYAAAKPTGTSFMARIGNAELVRGVSDLFSLCRDIEAEQVSQARYEQLVRNTRRQFDLHHWLADAQCLGAADLLREIAASAERVLDEYAKVEGVRRRASSALSDATAKQRTLLAGLKPERWEGVQDYVAALNGLGAQRGHLISLRELRYVDIEALDRLQAELEAAQNQLAIATADYLAKPEALQPIEARLGTLDAAAQAAGTAQDCKVQLAEMHGLAADLDLLSNLVASLPNIEAGARTALIESISAIYARLNQAKARAEQRRRALGESEGAAQFGAQLKLFGQSVTAALAQANDPERCEEQLARVLLQLEGIESQFGEHEAFLQSVLEKREEVLEAFETQRQALLEDRQRRAQALLDAAMRILDGLPRRTARLSSADELHSFFAGDALILKLRELVARLRELRDSVKADSIEARLKAARDAALRALRDAGELYEAGGEVVRFGPHRFSVNRQVLDLTLLPRDDRLFLHLTGTDFLEPVAAPELDAAREFWFATLESESAQLYRGEYLAGLILSAARDGREGLTLERLCQAQHDGCLDALVREFATPRYKEGYEKGIHDHDAARILAALLPLEAQAGLLSYEPAARAGALLAWQALQQDEHAARWPQRARATRLIESEFGHAAGRLALQDEVADRLRCWAGAGSAAGLGEGSSGEAQHRIGFTFDFDRAAAYLVRELAAPRPQFVFSKYAQQLVNALQQQLRAAHAWDELQHTLQQLGNAPAARISLAGHALQAACTRLGEGDLGAYVPEAAALLLLEGALSHRVSEADLRVRVDGLLGEHPRIEQGRLQLAIDDFERRFAVHCRRYVPGLVAYHAQRQAFIEREREALRLEEFKPRPLTSFVRNKLIDEVYLPLVGANLAKQIGTLGEAKRSDLMGLLLLISPPGYGKTTLMEYVAHCLGLIFMKINGPALGHDVHSLDPAQAPSAPAARELEKLNLALEMGNNVMLYVDDIQHTHPEFLQKFISLCDGTRRIEGVWRGKPKVYDLRGKKFCVVMAGNPYTESGELFKIPDMLANRADVYNLGEVLGGREDAFLLSYLENCLTSNPILAPLATRDMQDFYRLVAKAEGRDFSANALGHGYTGAEIDEITAVLERLVWLRDRVYRVNKQYIASAAQDDRYRSEPAFKLQGSYRNMNKLAEKVSPVMNDAELARLLDDHYLGEAQLLTSGAEANLLKLGELLGRLAPEQSERWAAIRRDFQRHKAQGGADADVGTRVIAQLQDLVETVRGLQALPDATPAHWPMLLELLERILDEHTLARTFSRDSATDSAMWLGGLRNALDVAFKPLISALHEHANGRSQQQRVLEQIAERLAQLGARAPGALTSP